MYTWDDHTKRMYRIAGTVAELRHDGWPAEAAIRGASRFVACQEDLESACERHTPPPRRVPGVVVMVGTVGVLIDHFFPGGPA